MNPRPSLVGRDAEIDQLEAGLEDARAGSGSAWLVVGEAGVGKTRLVEELALLAGSQGVRVHWGRVWESGGAPAYWPWIQILRDVCADRDPADAGAQPGHRAAHLATLLPELYGDPESSAGSQPATDSARFQLLEAVLWLLSRAADRAPRLLIIEDLHAADPSSLILLEFLAGQLRGLGVTFVATYREVEGGRGQVGQLIAKVSRSARIVMVRRLSRHDVGRFLQELTQQCPDDAAVDALFTISEGNPLFLTESARWLAGQAGALTGDVRRLIPGSLRAIIQNRLASLDDLTRELLTTASTIGREFSRSDLAEICTSSPGEVALRLAEAVDEAILHETQPGTFRFFHTVVREVLHDDLKDERREQLHLALARLLEARGQDALGECAHHYIAAGHAASRRASEVATLAAERALEQLAFEDAADLYELALAAIERLDPGEQPESVKQRTDVLLGLARARMLAGDIDGGRQCCLQAATLSRTASDAERLARAALEYGGVFVVAVVDPQLIQLLEEALEQLPAEDSALRSQLLARLAAASQPAPDPTGPIELANQAIVMARRLGDDRTLLVALRSGCSAMVDMVEPRQRLALNREHVALAERFRSSVDALTAQSRLVFDCFELGDLVGAAAAVQACDRLSVQLGHPQHRWRVLAFQAMVAQWEGDFAAADQLRSEAVTVAGKVSDPNAERSLLLQRLAFLRSRGCFEEALALLPRLSTLFGTGGIGHDMVTLAGCELLARSSRDRNLDPETYTPALERLASSGDRTQIEVLSRACVALRDTARAQRLIELALPARSHHCHGSIFALSWDFPRQCRNRARVLLSRRNRGGRCRLSGGDQGVIRFASRVRVAVSRACRARIRKRCPSPGVGVVRCR